MSLIVQSTDKLNRPWLSILLYGQGKKGKTTFGSTMPDPLFLSMEPGMISLADLKVDYVEPASWAELLAIQVEIMRGVFPGGFSFQGKKYQSLITDPANELYRVVMDGVLAMSKGREIPSQPDWGLTSDRVERFIKDIARQPFHSLFTCLEAIDKDEYTGRIIAGPMLPGKLGKKAHALVDFIWHMETQPKKGGGVEYVIATCDDSIYPAGGRYGKVKLEPFEKSDFQIIYGKFLAQRAAALTQ